MNGSNGSGGGGAAAVLTAQNMHPRVQVSPSSMMVPVPPLQHSPIFGHLASSQTVFKLKSFKESFTCVYLESGPKEVQIHMIHWTRIFPGGDTTIDTTHVPCDGAGTLNHDGRPFGISAPT